MAYTLTKAEVLSVAGELAALDDPRWTTALETAALLVANEDAWGGAAKAKKAAIYLAAHLAKLMLVATAASGTAASSGPLSQITVGPVSKSFNMMGPSLRAELDASLSLTPYGVTFRMLQRIFSFSRGVVT